MVSQATVYVLPYRADDTNQAYEHFQAYNGYYQTPVWFNAMRRYTIYIVCTGPDGQQYSYSNDFAARPSYAYNECKGTAYMEPDNDNNYGGGNGND